MLDEFFEARNDVSKSLFHEWICDRISLRWDPLDVAKLGRVPGTYTFRSMEDRGQIICRCWVWLT